MNRKYCYITLLTNDTYVRGVILLNECLRKTESKYPLLCLITDDVDENTRNILTMNNINYQLVNKIEMPEKLYNYNKEQNAKQTEIWKYCLTKFNIFKMTEYNKIIFLDADLLILKNLDHCFKYDHMTAALDGEYINLWPNWPHFNSGFMVIEPNIDTFNSIMNFSSNITDDLESIKDYKGDKYLLADQEILNLYYNDWYNNKNLHLSKYYNIFPVHTPDIMENDIWQNGYFVHFVGTKPWECYNIKEGLRSKFCITEYSNKIGCLSFYEYSFAILNLIYSDNYKNLNWTQLTTSGELEYQTAAVAKDLFRDFERAKKYIDLAINKNPNNENFLKLEKYINNALLAKELYPSIKVLLSNLIEYLTVEGLPTMKLYAYLSIMEEGLETDQCLNVILDFWNMLTEMTKDKLTK